MRLPKSVTTVTPFSKLLAFVLILTFLVTSFFLGMLFQKETSEIADIRVPIPTPMPVGQSSCSMDSDCMLTAVNAKDSCCPNIKCLDFASSDTIAVNEQWFTLQKQAVCGVQYACPMIALICSQKIVKENTHYAAQCVSHVCQKVRN